MAGKIEGEGQSLIVHDVRFAHVPRRCAVFYRRTFLHVDQIFFDHHHHFTLARGVGDLLLVRVYSAQHLVGAFDLGGIRCGNRDGIRARL